MGTCVCRAGEDARALASVREQAQSAQRALAEEQQWRQAAEAERDQALHAQVDRYT
jgi:hypothetical protein